MGCGSGVQGAGAGMEALKRSPRKESSKPMAGTTKCY